MDNTKAKYNIIFSIILILVSLFGLIESIRMPRYSHLEGWYAAPGLVPSFLAISLLLMGIVVFVSGVKKGGLENFSLRSQKELSKEEVAGKKRMYLALLLITIYLFLLLGNLHYMIATGIFVFVFSALFREGDFKKRFLIPLIIAVVGAIIIYYGFNTIFMIPLP